MQGCRSIRILPRKVLESLSNHRIEAIRVEPIEDVVCKHGGQADVELASLRPRSSSQINSYELVAVRKMRFSGDKDDERVLAPFAYELRLISELNHENIVRLRGFVEDSERGIAWTIFAWEVNGNVLEFVQSKDWEIPERVSMIRDVMAGVGYLHNRDSPICHGDLKSLNILVTSEYRAIVSDFGSARVINYEEEGQGTNQKENRTLLKTNTASGSHAAISISICPSESKITLSGFVWSLRWAAPELLAGEAPTLASDIWALGLICLEIMTGALPFSQSNETAVALSIIQGEHPQTTDSKRLDQFESLRSLMLSCWSHDPVRRPTAEQCHKDIELMGWVIPSDTKAKVPIRYNSSEMLNHFGRTSMREGKLGEATEYFQRSLNAARSTTNENATATALLHLGQSYQEQGYFRKAKLSYSMAHDKYLQLGCRDKAADAMCGLGNTYNGQADYFAAEEWFSTAKSIYNDAENMLGIAVALRGLGDACLQGGKHEEAESQYTQAMGIYVNLGRKALAADMSYGLGRIHQIQSNYAKAEVLYADAKETYRKLDIPLSIAKVDLGLGEIYFSQGYYRKAMASCLEAKDAYDKSEGLFGMAEATRALAAVHCRQNDYFSAEISYIQAQNIYAQLEHQRGAGLCAQGLEEVRKLTRSSEIGLEAPGNLWKRTSYIQAGAPESLWEKFHNYCRAQKMLFNKVEVNTGNDTSPEWLVTIQVRDRSWTNARPERTKMLAKEDVARLILKDWATMPQLLNAQFPPFGGSVVD